MATIRGFEVTLGFDCTSLTGRAETLEQLPLFHACFEEEVRDKLGAAVGESWTEVNVGASGYNLRYDGSTGIIDEPDLVLMLKTFLRDQNPAQAWTVSIDEGRVSTCCEIDPDTLQWKRCWFAPLNLNGLPWLGMGTAKLLEARYAGTIADTAKVELSALRVRLCASWRVADAG